MLRLRNGFKTVFTLARAWTDPEKPRAPVNAATANSCVETLCRTDPGLGLSTGAVYSKRCQVTANLPLAIVLSASDQLSTMKAVLYCPKLWSCSVNAITSGGLGRLVLSNSIPVSEILQPQQLLFTSLMPSLRQPFEDLSCNHTGPDSSQY